MVRQRVNDHQQRRVQVQLLEPLLLLGGQPRPKLGVGRLQRVDPRPQLGSLGGNYVAGCLALQSVKPVIRIVATGYWDSYNDF